MKVPRLILLAAISCAAFAAEPDEAKRAALVREPFVQVQKDRSLVGVAPEVGDRPAGFPAFETLTLLPQKGTTSWVLSGTVVSTNAGGKVQGAVIYAGYGDLVGVIGMTNMKGEVLLRISQARGKDGQDMLPDAFYIGSHLTGPTPRVDECLRKYPFREMK
jgi:hypothetical protein